MADESTPFAARLLGAGARGAGAVGRVTGIDKAVEMATEEAIVSALESEAVERAIARVLEGPVIEEAVQGALDSAAVKKAIIETLDSELVDEVWRRLLAGPQVQQMVERIAEAPEVRAAIASQSVGLIGDIARQIAKLARDLDNTVERILRAIFFRRPRPLPTNRAGVVTRGAAFVIDAVIINLFFTVLAGAVTLLVTFFGGSGDGVPRGALAAGSLVWLMVVGTYLVGFWSLAGQTPGMRFLGIRLDERRLPLRRSIRRLIGMGLSVVTFGIGFLGIVFGEARRGWADRMGGTEVVYDERRPAPAPWSTLGEAAAAPPLAAPAPPLATATAPAAAAPAAAPATDDPPGPATPATDGAPTTATARATDDAPATAPATDMGAAPAPTEVP
ncbi:MAG TPA: RDD family protein [Solirubrobacterales bacterium]|nr:RDD family protein [Solirubrobacterales bacterium]